MAGLVSKGYLALTFGLFAFGGNGDMPRSPDVPCDIVPTVSVRSEDLVKAELDAIQGRWSVTHLEIKGKRVPLEYLDDTARSQVSLLTPCFLGDAWIQPDGRVAESARLFTVKLHPDQSPKAIDLVDDDRKEVTRGIYEISEATLTMCFDLRGEGQRPTVFATMSDQSQILIVYERQGAER